MRVLLISPLRGIDPTSGDVTYTEELLASPPSGVSYVTYTEATETGELVWVGTRAGFGSTDVGLVPNVRALIARKAHRVLARLGIAFREPVLTAHVAGEFDLVHIHVFNLGFVGAHPPVVASNACPTSTLYSDAEHWARWRITVARWVHRWLAHLSSAALISEQPLIQADWIVFSELLARQYVQLGVEPNRISIIPNSISGGRTSPRSPRAMTLGFCARDFAAKGGDAVLEAFSMARAKEPDLRLECVGHETPEKYRATEGVSWHGEIPRERLLAEVLPSWGAMVYPTHFDGVPYAVIEALAASCPVITVPYGAMPEIVPHGVAGFIAANDSPEALADGIAFVLDPSHRPRLAAGAQRWFSSHYCSDRAFERVGDTYQRAITRTPAAHP